MFLIAVSAKYKTKPSEHCGSGGIVSTTLILNSGVYLLFGCPFGIKMPPFVRLFNWYISIIPYCLTKGEHFTTGMPSLYFYYTPECRICQGQYRTKSVWRLCTPSACKFPVIFHKNAREYIKYSLRFLFHLTKNLTTHLSHNLCAVLPTKYTILI